MTSQHIPEILAGDLVKNLATQIAPFQPSYTLGERADTIEKLADGSFKVTTNKGTEHNAPVVFIAGGLGSFEPRKPPIKEIVDFEDCGVEYIIKDPEIYRGKKSSHFRRG
jgi:thioredoxin reductase (NADPH)